MKDFFKFGAYVAAFVVGAYVIWSAATIVTAPLGVVSRTLETDNIISSYERFHDRYQAFNAKKQQITAHKSALNATTGESEKNKLQIEVLAMQQACRDLAASYNADSTKTNKSIFKGKEALPFLNMQECNV